VTQYRFAAGAIEVLAIPAGDDVQLAVAGVEVLVSAAAAPGPAYILSSSSPGETYVTLFGSTFDVGWGTSTSHAASIWLVRRTGDKVVVYESTHTSTGELYTVTLSTGSLGGNTLYEALVLHKNGAGEVSFPTGWGAGFVTLASDVTGYLQVVYLSSAGAEISSTLLGGTTSLSWTDYVYEGLTIPAGCVTIQTYPYKVGTGLYDVEIRHLQIDRGALASGYHPSIFRPELHDETRIPPSWKDIGSTQGAVTVDWTTARRQMLTLDGAATLSFEGLEAGGEYVFYVDRASAGAAVTWPSGVKWAGGTAPTQSTSTGALDIFEFDATSTSVAHGSVKSKDSK